MVLDDTTVPSEDDKPVTVEVRDFAEAEASMVPPSAAASIYLDTTGPQTPLVAFQQDVSTKMAR